MKTIKTGLAALILAVSVQGVQANDIMGIIIGGAAGGLLGHQIGPQNSTEKTVATVAGALIGAQVGQNLSGYSNTTVMSAPQAQPSVYHVPKHRPQKHAQRWSDYQPQPPKAHRPVRYVPVYDNTPTDSGSWQDKISLLEKLGELRKAGVLTGEEFEAEKARILSGA